MCFASKNVNRAVPICTTYVQLSTVLLMKYKIKNLDQQLRPFSKILILELYERQARKKITYSDCCKCRWSLLRLYIWAIRPPEFCSSRSSNPGPADRFRSKSDRNNSERIRKIRIPPPTTPNPANRPVSFLNF